jgi:hypothetical protein
VERFIRLNVSEEDANKWMEQAKDPDPYVAIFGMIKTSAWNCNCARGSIKFCMESHSGITHCISWEYNPDTQVLLLWEWCDYDPSYAGRTFVSDVINRPDRVRYHRIIEGTNNSDLKLECQLKMIINAIEISCQ